MDSETSTYEALGSFVHSEARQAKVLGSYLRSSIHVYERHNVDLKRDVVVSTQNLCTRIEVRAESMQCAYPGITHGGEVSFYLDSAAGIAALLSSAVVDNAVLTHSLEMKFLKPLRPGKSAVAVGRVETSPKSTNRISCTSELVQEGELVASARAEFVMLEASKVF